MINGMESALVLEHENLVFQVSRDLDIGFFWAIRT
jgi:hypothetical protein